MPDRLVHIEGRDGLGRPVYLTQTLKWSTLQSARGVISFERACDVMDEIFYHGSYDDINGMIVDE